jgi:hypothetical protein
MKETRMADERFVVVRAECTGEMRWLVRKGGETYGEYLSEDCAVADALEAAQDARLRGAAAQVLVEDASGAPRLQWSSAAERARA